MIRNALSKAIGIIKYAERTECGVTARSEPLVGGRDPKGVPGLEVIVVQGIGDRDLPAIWNYDFDFYQSDHFIRRYWVRGKIPVRLTKILSGLFPFCLINAVQLCDSLRMAPDCFLYENSPFRDIHRSNVTMDLPQKVGYKGDSRSGIEQSHGCNTHPTPDRQRDPKPCQEDREWRKFGNTSIGNPRPPSASPLRTALVSVAQ